jgi:hypothetical protein
VARPPNDDVDLVSPLRAGSLIGRMAIASLLSVRRRRRERGNRKLWALGFAMGAGFSFVLLGSMHNRPFSDGWLALIWLMAQPRKGHIAVNGHGPIPSRAKTSLVSEILPGAGWVRSAQAGHEVYFTSWASFV